MGPNNHAIAVTSAKLKPVPIARRRNKERFGMLREAAPVTRHLDSPATQDRVHRGTASDRYR